MKNKILNHLLVKKNSSIKETMRAIDRGGLGTAFVIDKNKKFFGLVTDGDIRRAILRGVNIGRPIEEIANKNPIVFHNEFLERELSRPKINKDIKKRTPIHGSLKIPVLNNKREVKDLIFVYPDGKHDFLRAKAKLNVNNENIKKVLVIGGAGYLGSVLCRKLLNERYKVRVLDNLTYGDEGIKELYSDKNFDFLKGDIRNISDVVEAVKDIDAVIHLAAIVGDPACASDSKKTLEINYLATKNITEICKYFQINRFIFASTCSIYGASLSPNKKLTEESSLNPISLYAETKIKCEQSILEATDENFSPTIFRMATLYGFSPLMRFDLVVNLLTAKAIFDKKITIFGGSQWRPWLHISDAANSYLLCLKKPIEKIKGEIFNVLSENYKIIEIGKIIKSLFKDAKLEINSKITDCRDYNVSFDKISKSLGFRPKIKIKEGIKAIEKAMAEGLISNYKDTKYRFSLPQI